VRIIFPEFETGGPNVRQKFSGVAAMQIAHRRREHHNIANRQGISEDQLSHRSWQALFPETDNSVLNRDIPVGIGSDSLLGNRPVQQGVRAVGVRFLRRAIGHQWRYRYGWFGTKSRPNDRSPLIRNRIPHGAKANAAIIRWKYLSSATAPSVCPKFRAGYPRAFCGPCSVR
jgi:hypothetical protein